MTEIKIKKLDELRKIIDKCRIGKKKIIFTNGCFDILHAGHVEYLEAREDVCLKIMDALEQIGLEIAFPSQTLYMHQMVSEDKQD